LPDEKFNDPKMMIATHANAKYCADGQIVETITYDNIVQSKQSH